tara:strand:+ start:3715 stop:4281 length:567 start_codon:yes stop_codon:yes gene_type:complete
MILSAAVQVLQDEGPTKLTQTRVAKAAGLRQGHLTYYFPRKSDLWIATAERAHDEMEAQFAALLSSSGLHESKNKVRPKLVELVTNLVGNRQRSRVLLSLVLQAQEEEELNELCQQNARRSREFLTTVLAGQYSAPIIEVALAAFWGLGMRELISGVAEETCETHELVSALFELLDAVPQPTAPTLAS